MWATQIKQGVVVVVGRFSDHGLSRLTSNPWTPQTKPAQFAG